MGKYLFGILLCCVCLSAKAEVSCPTGTINDSGELMALKKDIETKLASLQKQMDDKCLPEYQERNRTYLKDVAAVENKEGEYKGLSKKEREALLTKKKYEYQNNQTKFSNECYGEEGKTINEYKDCLRSISKQNQSLQAEHKLKREAEAAAEKKVVSSQVVPASSATEAAKASDEVEVPGMVTTSKENQQPVSASTSSTSSSASSSGSSSSSGSLFSDLTAKGLEIFGGMREIIYAVAGFGVLAVAIGGFFGVINWRWLASIIIGLMVIASASSIINYMVDSEVISDSLITDSLISAT